MAKSPYNPKRGFPGPLGSAKDDPYTFNMPRRELQARIQSHKALYGKAGFQNARSQFKNFKNDSIDLKKSNILVTGANSGLGFETSLSLAQKNASVHLLCRNRERGEAACEKIRRKTGNPDVFLHVVDVSDTESIRSFASSWEKPIKCLVNNAGVMPSTRVESKQGIELSFATMAGGK